MKSTGVVLALTLAIACPVAAQSRPTPTSPQDQRVLAERFAGCNARVALVAFDARINGELGTGNLADGVANGWKLAGTYLLMQSLDTAQKPQAEANFNSMVTRKFNELRLRQKQDRAAAAKAGPVEYQKECQPWVETQRAVIASIPKKKN